jgi:hypothetical protein
MSLLDNIFKPRTKEEIIIQIARGYTKQIFELNIKINQFQDKIIELSQENKKLKESIQQMSGVDVK